VFSLKLSFVEFEFCLKENKKKYKYMQKNTNSAIQIQLLKSRRNLLLLVRIASNPATQSFLTYPASSMMSKMMRPVGKIIRSSSCRSSSQVATKTKYEEYWVCCTHKMNNNAYFYVYDCHNLSEVQSSLTKDILIPNRCLSPTTEALSQQKNLRSSTRQKGKHESACFFSSVEQAYDFYCSI
jgi:hypothetical protein